MHSHHGTGPNLDLPYISCWTNMHSVLIISGTGLCCFLTLYLALLGVCTQDVTENQHAACYSTPVISQNHATVAVSVVVRQTPCDNTTLHILQTKSHHSDSKAEYENFHVHPCDNYTTYYSTMISCSKGTNIISVQEGRDLDVQEIAEERSFVLKQGHEGRTSYQVKEPGL